MVRQASSTDDSSINDLLSTSLSDLFPAGRKHGKLDEHTNHTIDSTDRDLSEDESSDFFHGECPKKILSFEQDDNGDARVVDVTDDDSEQSLKFGDVFPEYQPGIDDSFVDLEESFAQIVCDVDVQNLRREQRKKVLKAFFAPMKSLVKPVKRLPEKIQRIKNPMHLPEVNFHSGSKRKLTRVTFAENPIYIVEEIEETSETSSEASPEEIDSTWYNDEEYDTMKKSVLKTMEKIVRCHKKRKEFAETDHQTARGLELVTKEMIQERKLYKISSRHVVFDEQEDQRVAHKSDPERIRNIYIEATRKAKDTALDYGWKDEEAVYKLNEETFCIDEEIA